MAAPKPHAIRTPPVLAKPQPPEAHPTEWFNQNKFNQANTTGTSLTVGTAIAGTSAYNAALLMTR